MLQAIHDNLKGVFAMIILGVLAVVFVFWGVEFVSVGGFSANQGVSVNGEDVSFQQVQQEYQDRITQLQVALPGMEIPPELRKELEQQVVDDAVRNELVRQRTEAQRFRASDRDVLELIRQIPAFQVDGQFSKDAYYAALRAANLEPAWFEEQQKQLVAARKLDRGLYASAFVLPGELERREALLNETREIAWIVLPVERFRSESAPDEAALAAWYEQNKDRYRTEEMANLQYVEVQLDGLAESLQVEEEQLLAWYQDNADRYTTTERRQVRHILITPEGDDAEGRARAAYDRAVAGEDFAALARELSQDPGSAALGGDLGWADRSVFVGSFADAAWSVAAGEVTPPVRTEFGWHVIKVDAVEPGATRSFEDARVEIEAEYRRSEAERLYGDLQEQLDTEAFEASGDLQRVAEAMSLEVQSLDGFTRSGGGTLGASSELAAAVFDPEVLNGSQLRTVEIAPGRVVAVKVVAHQPPRARPLDEVRAAAVADYQAEKAREAAQERAAALAEELRGGAEWAAVARPWIPPDAVDPTSAALRFANRSEPAVPAPVNEAVFKAPSPASGPVFGTTALDSGDAVVWTVTYVKPGSPASLTAAQRAQATREARDLAAMRDASVYVTQLRATADVKVNPQLFQ